MLYYGSLHPNGVFPNIKTSIGVGVSIMGTDAEARYHHLEERYQDKITRLQQPHIEGDFGMVQIRVDSSGAIRAAATREFPIRLARTVNIFPGAK